MVRGLLVFVFFAATPSLALAQIQLTLKDSFIEAFKNRVAIEADVLIDHSHKSPKTPSPSKPSNDGDIDASARSDDVGLPFVVEIMNAADARACELQQSDNGKG